MTHQSVSGRKSAREPRRGWRLQTLANARYSQSLERGLAVLRCFEKDRPVLGIADIADGLGMSRSTTHRYVITLVALGFLEQGPSRKYRLGLGVSDLGLAAIAGWEIRAAARPFLEELHARSSFPTSLAALDGEDVCWLDVVAEGTLPSGLGTPLLQPGTRTQAHCTAEGKLIMAFRPKPVRAALVAEMRLTKQGPNTITTKRGLLAELDSIRDCGFAVADEEQAAGVMSIAAPVRDHRDETIAALAVTAASSTIALGEMIDAVCGELVACAGQLTERIGPPPESDAGAT